MSKLYSKDELLKIELMVNEGYTIRSISKELNRSMSAISELIARHGFRFETFLGFATLRISIFSDSQMLFSIEISSVDSILKSLASL